MATLRPCPSCSRHARVGESACPFCGRELGDAFRRVPSPRAPAVGRLSRAALFAMGAGGLAASACSGSPAYGSPDPSCDPQCNYVAPDPSLEANSDAAGEDAPDVGSDGALVTEAVGVDGSPVDGSGDAPIDSAVSAPVDAGTFLIFYGAAPH